MSTNRSMRKAAALEALDLSTLSRLPGAHFRCRSQPRDQGSFGAPWLIVAEAGERARSAANPTINGPAPILKQMLQSESLDRVFHALSDTPRRAIVDAWLPAPPR
jgi:hypothetical protein